MTSDINPTPLAPPRITAGRRKVRCLEDVTALKPNMVYYSAKTCWWSVDPADLGKGHGIPTDPSGSPLYMTDDIEGFLESARKDEAHYGLHGLEAFLLAYHGAVVQGETSTPVCSPKWDAYNNLIDAAITDEPLMRVHERSILGTVALSHASDCLCPTICKRLYDDDDQRAWRRLPEPVESSGD